ncbi:FAD-dependent oxidoreductase [Hydrogenophaga pseudoflava]|uniref:FAD-dependent oxidoreductase n=1 Tax=Hydrogenophaga pseudoflava TaxID=47421 RepID=UPI0027E4496D|nr:FAD-dependent oxidoreductase [Hydrogenophaga pseudoflava]MDQ7745772.1 FAD-dependent oxidoreductase [Hydrogenophaga pseudoflava]
MQVLNALTQLPADAAYDLVVVGAGGAGMATALFAALDGKQVLLVERTEFVGGTTAWSAGTTWVPGTHHAAKVNPGDSLAEAARYLTNAIGERTPAALRQVFLHHGAAAIRLLEDQSDVQFRPYPKHPDYISDLAGSTLTGRALEPLPFDGRRLGELFGLVRPPIPEFTVLGGMMVDRTDINHLLGLTRSLASFRHSLRILLRHGLDRLSHPRGTRLVMGNALVARLLYSLSKQAGVTLLLNTSVSGFERDASGVTGLTLKGGGEQRETAVRGGVVLASGGFNRHPDLRARLLPGADIGWCPAAPGHTGEAHALAKDAGAVYGQGALSNTFWAPVSLRPRADGSTAVFPHFVMDRAKPGMLTVNRRGERFVNESTSYHLFGMAMQATGSVPAYLVCDTAALKKYGIGMVRPGASPRDLAPFLADGYLTQGATLDELAHKLGIDAAGLKASVDEINRCADTGVDPRFHRGETAYQQNIGDATAGHKNPNLGPLKTAPYFAVKLHPGDIGAATGFATDGDARVLDDQGRPIAGLYAVGNDMHSIMGGVYTAPGITIGPGLVFGHLAARHAGARAVARSQG